MLFSSENLSPLAQLEATYTGPVELVTEMEAKMVLETNELGYKNVDPKDVHKMALICVLLNKSGLREFMGDNYKLEGISNSTVSEQTLPEGNSNVCKAPNELPVVLGGKRERSFIDQMTNLDCLLEADKDEEGPLNNDCLYLCVLPLNWESPQKALEHINVAFAKKSWWPNQKKDELIKQITFVTELLEHSHGEIAEAVKGPVGRTPLAHEKYFVLMKKLLGVVLKLQLVRRNWLEIDKKVNSYLSNTQYFPTPDSLYDQAVIYEVYMKITTEMGMISSEMVGDEPQPKSNSNKRVRFPKGGRFK